MENYIDEMWLDISGYEGCYQISSKGRIRSLDRTVTKINYTKQGIPFEQTQNVKGKVLKCGVDRCGYVKLHTRHEGGRVNFTIHREVAKAFLPQFLGKNEVNHKDGNKQNNYVQNLEWVSSKENVQHAIESGLTPVRPAGKSAYRLKYETKVFDRSGNYLYSCYGHKELKENGFDPRLVHAVCVGKRSHHKNHVFEKHEIK